MKVINVFGSDFESTCKRLSLLTVDFTPDILIGVLTGGGYVGREVAKMFAKSHYTEICLHRGSSEKKRKFHADVALKRIPYWLLNILRVAEVVYYEWKVKFVKPERKGEVRFEDAIAAKLNEGKKKVLIVDDCIDTGYTLKTIIDIINRDFPGNEIKIAVITTAHKHPVVKADYSLYNRVLVRFPWSFDAKG